MHRKQVAIFLPSLVGGGAERMMLNLALGLARAGLDVDLVLAQAIGDYLDDVTGGVKVVDLGARRTITALPGLARYLTRKHPAALVSALDHANLVALAAKAISGTPTPVFVSVRNTLSMSTRRTGRLRDRLVLYLTGHFYGRAEAVIAVSRGVATDLASLTGLPQDRIKVIYNPVVTPELRALAAEQLTHPWFAPGAPPVILAAGRLTEQKGFATLISAFSQVRTKRSVRLLILGEGPERRHLKSEIRRLGLADEVRLEGFVKNPFAYMRRAALFVLSSLWEGLPGVLIQAMACGAPVVSTDCPSGPREILEDGRLGPLVPPGDATALADAMVATLDNPPGQDDLLERAGDFALDEVTRQYLEVLLGNR
jgi:glycosyltransferase involved in cell wall biosynthesis